ncbi:hypothetical protein HPP92_013657 [Vanilla planifolia]|uniref:Uncharacterized protein n=2 Tax=Vanilla planifolia TaxID=51239 RepID=A0A835R2U9_VANPL|nr:hypothetical protein HPP92_013657 [Vanilla planifolia]
MQKFLLAVDEMRKLSSGFELADLFPSLSFLGGLTGLTSRLERAHSCWDAILNEIIEEHLIKSGEGKDMDELIVDVLLRLREDKELDMHLTMDNIKAVISDLFVAGTETTSTFMDWAMTELIRHPHVMRKAQSEVRRYSNGGTGAQEWEINKLPYLSCIMKETFRLHPAAPLLVPRVGRETVDLFGYAVPAGSRVLINVGAIMRDPKYWDDPESFRPERFEGSAVDFKGANFEYTPFGAGRRICPGMAFAISNIEQWLAPLLCYFDWGLPDGRRAEELDVEESFGGAVSRKHDLIVVATPYMPAM